MTLSLINLNAKYFLHWMRHGGSFFLDAPPPEASPKQSTETTPSEYDEHDEFENLISETLQDYEDSWPEDDFNETVVILLLALVAAGLLWVRNQAPINMNRAQNPVNAVPVDEQGPQDAHAARPQAPNEEE